MATYKYDKYLTIFNDAMFDETHNPDDRVSFSGIYRCEGCGKEIPHNAYVSLPAQNHHLHDPSQGVILWRLVVCACTT